MASIFKRKGDKGWSIAWFDHEGKRRETAVGTTDKRLAERVAGIGRGLDVAVVQDPAHHAQQQFLIVDDEHTRALHSGRRPHAYPTSSVY